MYAQDPPAVLIAPSCARRPGVRPWRWSALAGLGLLQTACLTHWQDQRLSPAAVIEQQHPVVVRVTRINSSRVILREPRLADSVLVGLARDSALSISLADVARVALRRPGASTPVRVGAAGVGVGLLIYFLAIWKPLGS
jgi:hypothetical protein